MKNIISKICVWLLKIVFFWNVPELNKWIDKYYQHNIRQEFRIKTEVVNVKKGKRKYLLMFFKTPNENVRLTISRHDNFQDIISLLSDE